MQIEELENKIFNADSYEFIKQIPDKSVNLVIIDPPYLFQPGGLGIFKDRKTRYMDAIEDKKINNNYDLSILDELLRVMKNIYIYIYGVIKHNYINILIILKIKIVLWKLLYGKRQTQYPLLMVHM